MSAGSASRCFVPLAGEAAAGQDVPPELTCKPGDLIDITDGTAIKAIFETVRTDMGREVETKTKNAGATQGK